MSNYYQQMEQNLINSEAKKITQELSRKFNDELKNVKTLFSYYNLSLESTNNTLDLYKEYLDKNTELETKIKNSNSDILTNDRKTFYETEAHEKLDRWHKIFKWIYNFLAVLVIISLYFTEVGLSFWKKVAIIIIIVLYPIIIGSIIDRIYKKYTTIKSYIPKNVYNNL